MQVAEVFKTNVNEESEARELIDELAIQFPKFKITFDLQDCDKILRIEGKQVPQMKVIQLLNTCGYICEVLD